MKRFPLLVFAFLVGCVTAVYAGPVVGGRVIDGGGQPISGVSVRSDNIERIVPTDLDGRFSVNLIEAKGTSLLFTCTGYIPKSVAVSPGDQAVEVTMIIQIYPLQGITVTAGQAVAGASPVSFQSLDRERIARDFDIGEFPALLELTPNLYSYSDAGGGLGYSYLMIRGFDARRAPVYINGIPLNDPEDHALYFIDLPDFASMADNIQVQRGVGNSLYGNPSFGGSVNILTSPLAQARAIVYEAGYGGFWQGSETVGIMRKHSVAYATGLLSNGWSASGRWVKQYSDGYRENSWYDGTAYYLSVGRVYSRMISTVNIYGGPMKTHAAWDGIDRETMAQNRRANWYAYKNEIDNFTQPHFEWHTVFSLNDRLTFNGTLYHIRGKGYYEQLKEGQDLFEYNQADQPGTYYSDLIRRKWVSKHQSGANLQADYRDDKKQAVLGGSYYYFASEHWGEGLWTREASPSILLQGTPFRYYEYFGKYHNLSLFGSAAWQATERLKISANLQWRYLHKDISMTEMGIYAPMEYDLNWMFLSPRLGANYAIAQDISIYTGFSIASHEPNDDMIDDADDPSDRPNLEIIDSTVSPAVYGKAMVGAERIYDFELGTNYQKENVTFDANLFWMEYRNALVPDGNLNDDGFPTYGNADRSIHRGVEISGNWRIVPAVKIDGNFAANDFWIKAYDQYNWDMSVTRHRDVATPNYPRYLANLGLQLSRGPIDIVYRWRAAGRQFVSLDGRYATIDGETIDASIAPFMVSSLKVIARLGKVLGTSVTLEGRIDNLFNEKYETFGYRWGDYLAYWPAAERNWYTSIKVAI